MPLHTRILIGLVAGATLGGGANALLGEDSELLKTLTAWIAEPIGTLFLRLLLLLVVPLVFSSLVVGVAGLGDIRRIGRVGVKCLVYTVDHLGDLGRDRPHGLEHHPARRAHRPRGQRKTPGEVRQGSRHARLDARSKARSRAATRA